MSPTLAGLPPRYLRTPEAARFVGLSIRTLEKHRTYGTGPRYSKIGGRVVYRARRSSGLGRPRRQERRPPIPASEPSFPRKRHTAADLGLSRPAAPLTLHVGAPSHPHPNASSSNCSARFPAISRPAMRRTSWPIRSSRLAKTNRMTPIDFRRTRSPSASRPCPSMAWRPSGTPTC